jgi:hypothetical protein
MDDEHQPEDEREDGRAVKMNGGIAKDDGYCSQGCQRQSDDGNGDSRMNCGFCGNSKGNFHAGGANEGGRCDL